MIFSLSYWNVLYKVDFRGLRLDKLEHASNDQVEQGQSLERSFHSPLSAIYQVPPLLICHFPGRHILYWV